MPCGVGIGALGGHGWQQVAPTVQETQFTEVQHFSHLPCQFFFCHRAIGHLGRGHCLVGHLVGGHATIGHLGSGHRPVGQILGLNEGGAEDGLRRPLTVVGAIVIGIGGMVPHQGTQHPYPDTAEGLVIARIGSEIKHIVVGRLHGIGHAGMGHTGKDISRRHDTVDNRLCCVVGIELEGVAQGNVLCLALPLALGDTIP